MKSNWNHIERHRILAGAWESSPGDTFGLFVWYQGKRQYRTIAADGAETGWEHVSLSILEPNGKGGFRCVMPTWDDMCAVKAMFWDDEECVVQFHPPKSEYVNNHPACLHLWKCVNAEFPLPPSILVGLKEVL